MQLKALIVCCYPENGVFLDPADIIFPSVVTTFDVAVSSSAQDYGWLKKMSGYKNFYCDSDKKKLILKINSYDFMLAYPLSLNTLAKFTLGIRDSFPSEILAAYADICKPILLYENAITYIDECANPNFKRIYKNHWNNILGGSITSFNLENLDKKLNRLIRAKQNNAIVKVVGARSFITKEDIILASESLEPLKVSSSTIITDVAKEEAVIRGVEIIVE